MLLGVCLAATTDLSAQEPCGGTTIPVSGSEMPPYQIYQIATLCQLQAISTATTPTAYFQLTQDIEATKTSNWNVQDSVAKGFVPIGRLTVLPAPELKMEPQVFPVFLMVAVTGFQIYSSIVPMKTMSACSLSCRQELCGECC